MLVILLCLKALFIYLEQYDLSSHSFAIKDSYPLCNHDCTLTDVIEDA